MLRRILLHVIALPISVLFGGLFLYVLHQEVHWLPLTIGGIVGNIGAYFFHDRKKEEKSF